MYMCYIPKKDSLSESELYHGVDGYIFEPTRSDDDTAGRVSHAGDDNDSEVR